LSSIRQVPVRRQFDSELFMMEDWISPDDNVKVATMMRFLSLVCGDGECKDVATRSQLAAEFVHAENRKIEEGGSHITHTSHTNVGAHSPHSPGPACKTSPPSPSHDTEPCVCVCAG
jgi:hypothetical protein